MALDAAETRRGMQEELGTLVAHVPGAIFAAIASEDGLLTATCIDPEPNLVDRKGAVLASLVALARTAAKEYAVDDLRWVVLSCKLGMMLVRPFGRTRRRLLVLVIGESEKLAKALAAAKEFSVKMDAKYGAMPKVETETA